MASPSAVDLAFSPHNASMEAEWEDATRAVEESAARDVDGERRGDDEDAAGPAPVPKLSWQGLVEALRGDLRAVDDGELVRVQEHALSGFRGFFFGCCFPELPSELSEDRDIVLRLQKVPLQSSKPAHKSLLVWIYRDLQRLPQPAPDPMVRGSHWELLGFQGDDPSTDLRATGILGLLHLRYMLDEVPAFARRTFGVALDASFEFPFVLVGFNFSAIAVDALQQRSLHQAIRAAKKDTAVERPSFKILAEYYIGCWVTFLEAWQDAPFRSISDFGLVKASVVKRLRASRITAILAKAAALRETTSAGQSGPCRKVKSKTKANTDQAGGGAARREDFVEQFDSF